jgi:ankyrin repeat protein
MNENDESLINAIKSNDISLVASLIADGSANVNARVADMRNGSVLRLAAKLGSVEIVALLLDAGAHIDDVNDFCDSACHAAVRDGHTRVVELLVARNANVSLRNGAEETPIIIAINKRNEALVMLLIDAAMAAGALLDDATMCLAATISTDVTQLLLFKHRVDLTAIRDDAGRTPLHQAVWGNCDADVLDVLIDLAGIDVDARDHMGCTAVHTACAMRDVDALARLVAAGANLELADNNGDTPLHFGRFDSTGQITMLLLAAGANVHSKNNRGRTPCHMSSHIPRSSLVAFGASLDEPDDGGVSPRRLHSLLTTSPPTTEEIAGARRCVLHLRLSFVRKRAFEICVALQSLGLDALCMCEILLHSCGPVARFVPFHIWWQIATKIKHTNINHTTQTLNQE